MSEREASTVGGYELDAELGRGATGIVFRAHRIDDSLLVALKVLDPALTGDERFRERFAREADIMGRIGSDHCVAVFDHAQDATAAWIAMEYVHGATLRAVLSNAGRLTPAQACGVLVGALAGLGRAHALGLIHRDFKPDNILVNASGVSKLADFGLVADRLDTNAWRPIEGSPAYMSPEQVRGEVLDPRSDIYAAGAVLFELLAGHPPFTASTPLATLHAQVESPPPSVEALPERIGSVVLWALAKVREERPATAEELAEALRDAAARDLGAGWLGAAGIGGLVAGAVAADILAEQPTARGMKSRGLRSLVRGRPRLLATVAGATTAAVVATAVVVAGTRHNTRGVVTTNAGASTVLTLAPRAASLPNACTLLTTQDLAALHATGVKTGPHQRQVDPHNHERYDYCGFFNSTSNSADAVLIQVQVYLSANPAADFAHDLRTALGARSISGIGRRAFDFVPSAGGAENFEIQRDPFVIVMWGYAFGGGLEGYAKQFIANLDRRAPTSH